MTYLSATFKQAIADGSAWRSTFEALRHDGKRLTEGWTTPHFAVEDSKVIHYHINGTWEGDGYVITHLRTGYAVMSFAAHHVALNFMLELERLFADDDLLDSDVKKRLVQYINSRGKHICQTLFPKGRKAA